jgi:CheY-like chemotaxis protein
VKAVVELPIMTSRSRPAPVPHVRTPKVLIVDDDALNLRTIERVFRRHLDMRLAASGESALELLDEHFDVALVDYTMPGMTGVELLREIARRSPSTGRVLVTAHAHLPDVVDALASGLAQAVLPKPWERDDILAWVERLRPSERESMPASG